MGKFDAFSRYVVDPADFGVDEPIEMNRNIFFRIGEDEIRESEEKLGLRFPEGLREFYLEIGHGQLVCPASDPDGDPEADMNTILEPGVIAAMYLNDPEALPFDADDEETRQWLLDRFENTTEEGELPFFEIGEGYFLVTRPRSDAPEAIYHSGEGEPVARDMAEFMERLHADPVYY
jgi:hypothetical protein